MSLIAYVLFSLLFFFSYIINISHLVLMLSVLCCAVLYCRATKQENRALRGWWFMLLWFLHSPFMPACPDPWSFYVAALAWGNDLVSCVAGGAADV